MRWTLLALVLLGCGDDDDERLQTGQVCDQLGDAMCRRISMCGGGGYAECFQAVKKGCCIDAGTCGDPTTATAERVETCTSALASAPCPDIVRGVLPPICLMSR